MDNAALRALATRKKRCRRAVSLLFALTLIGAELAVAAVMVETPRPFGYVIGDTFEVRIQTDARASDVDEAALPRLGPVAAGLALRNVTRVSAVTGGGEFVLRYQVTGSTGRVETLDVPAWTLTYRPQSGRAGDRIEAFPISVSPLTPPVPLSRSGLEELRPALRPPTQDERTHALRAATYVALATLLIAWYAWRRWGRALLFPERAPFSRAQLELKRLPVAGGAGDRLALQVVHRAFDRAAGEVVMASDLDRFFARRPYMAALRAEADALFALSATTFFGDSAAAPAGAAARVADFCRRAARCERER